MLNQFAGDEAHLIERLNHIRPRWRERYSDIHAAAAAYLPEMGPGEDLDFVELDVDGLDYGIEEDGSEYDE